MTILDLPKLSRRYQPTGQTWLIDIYALLPQNVSFLECFWRSHVCFIRCCNKLTEITRNHFCDVFLEKQKYLRDMFLRRLRDVTKKTSFLRCIWDVLKTSQKRHLFWDVSERYLRYLSQWRSDWDLSETSHAGWASSVVFMVNGTCAKTLQNSKEWCSGSSENLPFGAYIFYNDSTFRT